MAKWNENEMHKNQQLKAHVIETLRRWIDCRDIDCKLDMTIANILYDMVNYKTRWLVYDDRTINVVSVESLLDGA